MPNKYKNIGILFLILGFLFITLGGFLLILGALQSIDLMLYIALALVLIGVLLYGILFILFIIYYSKRKDV